MANFDLVFVYDKKGAAEFEERGLPHPKVGAKNEMPNANDLLWAIDSLEFADYDRIPYSDNDELLVDHIDAGYGIRIAGFDWANRHYVPGEDFAIYGHRLLSLAILIKLCERCGQLLVYPDTGEPPIVLDATMNADAVDTLHSQSESWEEFFEAMYGAKKPKRRRK
jgi:hypothetical protein